MAENTIITEIKNQIGYLTINRPDAMNALNIEMMLQLRDKFQELDASPEVYTIIITGAGKAFIAGFDIEKEMDLTEDQALKGSAQGREILEIIEQSQKPVIAVINGYALGAGLELALCCDIRISGDKAKFGLPEVVLGVIPGFGGTQRLMRQLGIGIAKKMILTGEIIRAEKALQIGLIEEIYPQEELMDKAIMLANTINLNGLLAVRNAKKAINYGAKFGVEEGYKEESKLFANCYTTSEPRTRMKEFLRQNRRRQKKREKANKS